MMLTSLQNPLVKHIRKLHRPKYRQQHQCFLLEGTHLLQEAQAVDWPLTVVCYTPPWCQKYPDLQQQLHRSTPRSEVVSPEVLAAMATTATPDGVVAIAPSTSPHPFPPKPSLGLVLETLQDPGNLGTMIRTATAAGADGLILSTDSVDPATPKVLRASAGSWFHLPMTTSHDLLTDLTAYRQQGLQLMATRADAPIDYWQLDLRPPTLILVGNEGAGLSPALMDLADHHIRIPMAPQVESLNAAITAALCLYEARRQRMEH